MDTKHPYTNDPLAAEFYDSLLLNGDVNRLRMLVIDLFYMIAAKTNTDPVFQVESLSTAFLALKEERPEDYAASFAEVQAHLLNLQFKL